jgi:hypothetical protein
MDKGMLLVLLLILVWIGFKTGFLGVAFGKKADRAIERWTS